jgi:hypothetical protein
MKVSGTCPKTGLDCSFLSIGLTLSRTYHETRIVDDSCCSNNENCNPNHVSGFNEPEALAVIGMTQ